MIMICKRLNLMAFFSVVCLSIMLTSCNDGDGSSNSSGNWSVVRNGNKIEIAYGSGDDFPQYAVLDLDSSYFRMTYSPSSEWGTSIILSPSFWEDGIYYQAAQVYATWDMIGSDMVISISGALSVLSFQGEVRIAPPKTNLLSATVTMDVTGDVVLDNRPGEAFKPIMLSSMNISDDSWDAQAAIVDSQSFSIPQNGWIINPPAIGSEFGLIGGTSDWKDNSPTIEVLLDQNLQITGWVTPSSDPNDDNVGFWAAFDEVIASWDYSIHASP